MIFLYSTIFLVEVDLGGGRDHFAKLQLVLRLLDI